MVPITSAQLALLVEWLLPEEPGPVVAAHVLNTGHGTAAVDRWPDPRAMLTESGGNYALHGNATAIEADEIRQRVQGFVAGPPSFGPLLREAFPDLVIWNRVVFSLPSAPPEQDARGYVLRRLAPADASHLTALSEESAWISKTWDGHESLASSGRAWGAFIDDRLVSVACPFFVGQSYEDIGVVTEPEFRGQGLSPACAAAVCRDIISRGRKPSWTTDPANEASRRVAEKLGFRLQREDVLYVAGVPVPEIPRRDE